ncbi:hypothetical protein TTRE_0000280501 [Trichuris trichiura]|uniref:Uncharacterized protein n=1 Tax=Trichuris trichiura TaxID=36087 RepID=A0A077Z786_TRITR|nr:hypothetical protein TTRE_0000280501 [Trichuris trichiura]
MLSDATDDLFTDHGCELIEDSLVSGNLIELDCRTETSSSLTELHGALLKSLFNVRHMLDFESLCEWSKVLETANFLCIDSPESFEQFCSDLSEYRLQVQRLFLKRTQRYHANKQEYQIAFLGEDEICDGEECSLALWCDTLESICHRTKTTEVFSDNVQPVRDAADCSSANSTFSGKQNEAYSFLLSFRDSLIFQAWLLQERRQALRVINAMIDYVMKGRNLDPVAKSLCTGVINVDGRLAEMTERLLHLETELKLQKCSDCVNNCKRWLSAGQHSMNFNENCPVREEFSVHSKSILSADKCQQTENSCSDDELDEGRLLCQLEEYLKRNVRSNAVDHKQGNGVLRDCNTFAQLKDLFSQRWTENENRLLTQIEELDAQLKVKEKQCKDCEDKIANIKDDYELQLRAKGRQLEAAKKFIVEQTVEHEEERQQYAEQINSLKSRLEEGISKESPGDSKVDPPSFTTSVETLKEDLALARASEEKLNNKIAQLQWTVDAISSEMEALKEERASLMARADEAASTESNLRATINDLRTEKWKLGQRNDELHCEKSLLSQQVHALMIERSHLESNLDEMKLQNSHDAEEGQPQLIAELNSLKLKEKEWKLQEKDLKKELQVCKNDLLEKAELISQLTEDYHSDDDIDDVALLRRRLKDKRDEVERLQTTLSQMQVHIVAVKDVQKAYEGQKSMNEIFKQSLGDMKNEIDSYKSKIHDLEQVLDQNLKEKENLSATILNLNEVVAEKTSALEQLSSQFDQWKENAQAQYDDTCCRYKKELEQLRDCLQERLDMKDEDSDAGGLWKVVNTAGRHFILETFRANLTAAQFEERLGRGNWSTAGFLLPTRYLSNDQRVDNIAPSNLPSACDPCPNDLSEGSTSDEVDSSAVS